MDEIFIYIIFIEVILGIIMGYAARGDIDLNIFNMIDNLSNDSLNKTDLELKQILEIKKKSIITDIECPICKSKMLVSTTGDNYFCTNKECVLTKGRNNLLDNINNLMQQIREETEVNIYCPMCGKKLIVFTTKSNFFCKDNNCPLGEGSNKLIKEIENIKNKE